MRRPIMRWLVVLVGFLGLTAVSHTTKPAITFAQPFTITLLPTDGGAPVQLSAQPVPPDQLPFGIRTVDSASNTCAAASFLTTPGGDQSNTSAFTEDASDPDLSSCMLGAPSSPRGYRTAWYKFTPTINGKITISTLRSKYDTVLALYLAPTTSPCDTTSSSLISLACNDDDNGFSSKIEYTVAKDVNYYIEVADWQSGVSNGNVTLTTALDEIDSRWLDIGVMPLGRTNHMTAVAGVEIYVLGGQTIYNGNTISNFAKFNVVNQQWTTLSSMPGAAGYAKTTAVQVDGRIYVPSGFDGNTSTFANKHWAYTINGNYWTQAATAPWPNGLALGYGTAIPSSNGHGYYFFGGITDSDPSHEVTVTNIPSHAALYYDTTTNTWDNTLPEMPTARYAHVGGLVWGIPCVAGGLSANGTQNLLITNTECYNPDTGQWSTFGNLNIPRYKAGSSVGSDGRWYIYGGINAKGKAVSAVEAFDMSLGKWELLDFSFGLGDNGGDPARVWAQGGFVGRSLWVMGGHNLPQSQVIPAINVLSLPFYTYIPFARQSSINDTSGDTLATAQPLVLNQAQDHNFDTQDDIYDVYYFDLPEFHNIQVDLTQIPQTSNFDIAIYDVNKTLWAESRNLAGQNESINITLGAGRYYVVVERVYPASLPEPNVYYRINVRY